MCVCLCLFSPLYFVVFYAHFLYVVIFFRSFCCVLVYGFFLFFSWVTQTYIAAQRRPLFTANVIDCLFVCFFFKFLNTTRSSLLLQADINTELPEGANYAVSSTYVFDILNW